MPNGLGIRPVWLKLETILDRRTWVYYLIIVEAATRRWAEQIEVQPDERFFQVLNKHVEAYVHEGQMPPEMIMPAVLNAADDVMAGRDVVLRAGDYISLQKFVREMG